MAKTKKDMISIGNSGEYFVAGELERHGFTAAVPMSNTKDFDILAIKRDESKKQFAIQVKTTTANKRKWTLSEKNEKLIGDNIFYVFVHLKNHESPAFYVVPSKDVAEKIKEEHEAWLNTPGKNGQKHNPNPIRKFVIKDDEYHDNWDVLK